MESALPVWLSRSALTNILKENVKDYVRIVHFSTKKASADGDSYLSEITRLTGAVEIENGSEKTIYFIIKNMDGGINEFLHDINGIEKEVGLYTDVAPYINRVLPRPIVPDCFFVSPNGDLLLEDLTASGYRLVNRMELLDYEHCEVALKTVALFHAATAKVKDLSPKTLAVIGQETSFTEHVNNANYGYIRGMILNFIEFADGRPEWSPYVEPAKKLLKNFQERIFAAVNTRRGFGVLNHGDLWLTNILFLYEGKKVVSSKVIDFQFTRYSSPAFDLHIFICTSMRQEVRENDLDRLLNIYLDTLNSTLDLVGLSQRLSKELLDDMMEDTSIVGLLYCLCLLPVSLCDPQDPLNVKHLTKADFVGGLQDENPYKKVFLQKRFQNHLLPLLKHFKSKGVF